MKKMQNMGGFFVAAITPFDAEGKFSAPALHRLMEKIGEQPEAAITCFVPDEKKAGGSYTCITGRIRRIDEISREIILTDRTAIPMDRIYGIAIVEEM